MNDKPVKINKSEFGKKKIVYDSSYIDLKKSKEEKLFLEKRRRHQCYTTCDYFFSNLTYFDFFSINAYEILVKAKRIAQLYHSKEVTSDFLLLSFLLSKKQLPPLLIKLKKDIFNFFSDPTFFRENEPKNSPKFVDIKFSSTVNFLLEKAAENSITRFKTPIITFEILLITLLEEKNTRATNLLKKVIKKEIELYLIRYHLLKTLHKEQVYFRRNVPKNEQYFGLLLQLQLSSIELETVFFSKNIKENLANFRTKVVREVLSQNFPKVLFKEINESIISTNQRNYS